MNFPARKLMRKMKAEGVNINSSESKALLEMAYNTRTKKPRSKK